MKDLRRVLERSELTFLSAQQVPLAKVFDAHLLRRAVYQDAMRPEGHLIACRTRPCKAAGHRLQTRAGHCAQCNTARIEYTARWTQSGFVYVAWSEQAKLTKVGFTQDPFERLSVLNSVGYAGGADWQIEHLELAPEGGKLESLVHRDLRHFRAHASYVRGTSLVECYEVFSCSPQVAASSCTRLAT